MRQISNKILKKLSERSKDAGLPPRSDLYISDTYPIDDIKCRVMLSYNKQLGEPSVAEIEEYIKHSFHNKIHAQTQSVRMHSAECGASLICTLNVETRPLNDATSLQRVTANSYVDPQTSALWCVVNDGQHKYLMRKSSENISELVEARKQFINRKEARFDNVKMGAPIPAVGDHVKFMSPDNVLLYGEITKINDPYVTIKANGGSVRIDRQSVIQIVDHSSAKTNEEKDKLRDYFAKAFGNPELADKLTSTISEEKSGLGSTVPSKGDLEKE